MKKLNLLLAGLAAFGFTAVAQNSPYISKVYDFCPAPGQFVNDVPTWEEGQTKEDVIKEVELNICKEQKPGMISLGGFGGYVIFGFDHPIVNVKDEYDFKVYGNAFVSNMESGGGSCEPGIVSVSQDTNGNGLPDDEWYELAGSEYGKETTKKNYKITYYRPDPNKTAVPDPSNASLVDTQYIKWTTNYEDEASGYVIKNSFHGQPYWPQWLNDKETLEFEGTKLENNGVNNGTNENPYWVLYFLDWGYVDNKPNDKDPGFKIEWAVDKDGKPVHLSSIDFIKVHNAMNQSCGWLGETSTEICGGEDLHPDAVSGVETAVENNDVVFMGNNEYVLVVRCAEEGKRASIFSISGMLVQSEVLSEGDNTLDISSLSNGIYLLNVEGKTVKFRK